MPKHLKQVAQWALMAAITSVLFGWWQQDFIAGTFMFFFLATIYGAIEGAVESAPRKVEE